MRTETARKVAVIGLLINLLIIGALILAWRTWDMPLSSLPSVIGPDSGVQACQDAATHAHDDDPQTYVDGLRHSQYADLRAAGSQTSQWLASSDKMDHAELIGSAIMIYNQLRTACGAHGVTMPAIGDL